EDWREANGLSFGHPLTSIYNNSWGPRDQERVDLAGPGELVRETFRRAVQEGRGGRGAVYVWAAGNGAQNGHRSDYDGYANSRYTIAVGAVGQDGQAAAFSEPGSNVFITAPSFSA